MIMVLTLSAAGGHRNHEPRRGFSPLHLHWCRVWYNQKCLYAPYRNPGLQGIKTLQMQQQFCENGRRLFLFFKRKTGAFPSSEERYTLDRPPPHHRETYRNTHTATHTHIHTLGLKTYSASTLKIHFEAKWSMIKVIFDTVRMNPSLTAQVKVNPASHTDKVTPNLKVQSCEGESWRVDLISDCLW